MSEHERLSLVIEGVNSVASVLVPVLLAIGAVLLHRYTKAIDHRLDAEREANARKSLRFEELSTLMNDIYCFTVLVGHYRAISPLDVVETKRKLEAIMFATLPMWDAPLLHAATEFVGACFVTKRGRGETLRLTSDMERQREERVQEWNDSWEDLFLRSDERATWIMQEFGDVSFRNDVVKPRYARFLATLSRSIGGRLSENDALSMLQGG